MAQHGDTQAKMQRRTARKIFLGSMMGLAGVAAAVLGVTLFSDSFGVWMTGSAVLIMIGAVAFRWNDGDGGEQWPVERVPWRGGGDDDGSDDQAANRGE